MRTTPTLAAVLSATLLLPLAVAANPVQSGDSSDCIDDLATFVQTQQLSPLATMVTVEPDTMFAVSASQGNVYVDFFSAAGTWVAWNAGRATGTVPSDAAFGTICVGLPNPTGVPAPLPTASWTYQDGFTDVFVGA